MSAVYQIRNMVTGKVYVGYTTDFRRRISQHLFRLRDGQHHSRHMQAAFNKYGEAAFDFSVIEPVEREVAVEREQFWIDSLNACDPQQGYNVAKKVGYNPGCPHTVEAKRLMAEQRRDHPATPRQIEANRKIGKSRRGVKRPPEVVARVAAALVGHKVSEETRQRLSAAVTGFKHTKEARAKISAASTGREASDETRQRMSEAQHGLAKPEGFGKRMSETKSGKFLGSERYNANAVVQCDLDGNVIAIFDAGASASRATGVANSSISKVVKGKLASAGGFLWRRTEQDETK